MESFRDDSMYYDIIKDSYLWSKTNEEDYSYLIETLEKENDRRPIHDLILSVCYYETEQYERLLRLSEQKHHDNEYDDVIQLLRWMAEDKTEQLVHDADRYIEKCHVNHEMLMEEFVLRKLIRYCDRKENIIDGYRYQKLFLNIHMEQKVTQH
ncbi:MAG: hypothetical protein ACI32N_07505 [Bulleidia sp.]